MENDILKNILFWISKYRKKILMILFVPVIFSIACYFLSDELLKHFKVPLKQNNLYFVTPVEAISVKLKLSLFFGIICSFPVIATCITVAFKPLISKTKFWFILFLLLPLAVIIFYGGMFFAYTFIMPTTINFLIDCSNGIMTPIISGNEYISFVEFFLLLTGLIFELPLVLVALSRIGIVKSKTLMKKRGYVIFIIIIVLAILTPTPDAFTLLSVSSPVILLFELSIWTIFIIEKVTKNKLRIK
jgi:sec-independent protein translocase protein TatC